MISSPVRSYRKTNKINQANEKCRNVNIELTKTANFILLASVFDWQVFTSSRKTNKTNKKPMKNQQK